MFRSAPSRGVIPHTCNRTAFQKGRRQFFDFAGFGSLSLKRIGCVDAALVDAGDFANHHGPQAFAKRFCEVTAVQRFALHVAHGQHIVVGVPQGSPTSW